MNESRLRIITDATPGQLQRGVPQLQRADAGQADIDGFGAHVQAVPGDARGVGAKKFVGIGRAVSADDVKLGIGRGQGAENIGQQIEDARVVTMHFAGARVAQETVELVEGAGNVRFACSKRDVDPFAGVRVIEAQAALDAGGFTFYRSGPGEQKGC